MTGAAAIAAATKGASVCDGLKVTIGDELLLICVWYDGTAVATDLPVTKVSAEPDGVPRFKIKKM